MTDNTSMILVEEKDTTKKSAFERSIKDLDIPKFIKYFLSPHDPNDSLEFMVTELLTLKCGEELESYRQAVVEMRNPRLRNTVREFVNTDYKLKSFLEKRKKIIDECDGDVWRAIGRDTRELIDADYQILKHYCKSIEKTQQIRTESNLLNGIKEFGSAAREDEHYKISEMVIDDMKNFGESMIDVRYSYFGSNLRMFHIKADTKTKMRKMIDWYIHRTKCALSAAITFGFILLHVTDEEKLFAKFLEYLIGKNAPSIQTTLEYRKITDFLLGSNRYAEKIESNKIPLTYPDFTEEGVSIKELYNPCLLLQKDMKPENIVSNDVESKPEKNVAVITGPNNTGKSVYLKSIGLAVALAQNGFPLPSKNSRIMQFDKMHTHFVQEEDIALGEGAYLDELKRMKEVFETAKPNSLLLINEPIKGSSPEDSVEVTLRFIKGYRKLKAPTFITTHYHDVAKEVDGWEGVKNLKTDVRVVEKEIIPSYKIMPGKAGKSYGVEIADKFGLTEEGIYRMVEKNRQIPR